MLILWGLLSRQNDARPAPAASEPDSVSEAASEPVNETVALTPDLVGRDYDAEVRNNRSYINDYLFYVTLEYSNTVEKGRIIRQTPEAGEVIQKGDTISLVVSRGPQMMEMPDIIGQTMVEVGTTVVLYIAGDAASASGSTETPPDTEGPAVGGDAVQDGIEYDTD